MKCYRYIAPAPDGRKIETDLTEDQIIEQFWDFWCEAMKRVNKEKEITRENCIDDFVTIHWAWEIDPSEMNKSDEEDFDEF